MRYSKLLTTTVTLNARGSILFGGMSMYYVNSSCMKANLSEISLADYFTQN